MAFHSLHFNVFITAVCFIQILDLHVLSKGAALLNLLTAKVDCVASGNKKSKLQLKLDDRVRL